MSLKLKGFLYSLIIHLFVLGVSFAIISYMNNVNPSKTYVEIDLSKIIADLEGGGGGGGGGGGSFSSRRVLLRGVPKGRGFEGKALEIKKEERGDVLKEEAVSEGIMGVFSVGDEKIGGLEGGIASRVEGGIGSGMGSGVGSGMGSGMGSGIGSGIGEGMGSGMGKGVGEGVGSGKGRGYGSGEAEAFLASKLSLISQIVQQRITYPYMARRLGLEGKVVVSFLLTREGEVKEIRIEESSSHTVLDENAIETIKKCSSLFPVPPLDVKVRLPISYRLERASK
jgi:protein TonB